jgi:hypothetical protein
MRKLGVLLLFALAVCSPLQSQESMEVTIGGFSISVPPGWLAQYTKSPYVFILYSPPPESEGDNFRENCNLVVETLPSAYSLAGYMKASVAALKTVYVNFEMVRTEKNRHLIMGEMNGVRVKQLQYFYIKGKEAYVLTFSSTPDEFEQYAEVFAAIADSFRY